MITDHPFWQEADVPVSSLHIFDPEKDDIYDPYNRVQDTDLYHVDRLIPNIAAILQKKPLVIDDKGYILDGNHRALAAEKAGLQTVPVWQPVKGQKGVAESVSENTDDLLEFQLDELAAWHGSFLPRIGKFKPFSHFGSEQAARERLEWMAANDTRFKGQHTGFLYRLDLGITAPAKVKDYPNLQDISTGSVAKIEKWCNDIANDPRAKAYREDIKEQVRLDQKTQQPVYRIKTYSGSHLLRVFGYNTIWGHWHEWGVTNQQRIAQFVTLLKKMGIDGLVYKNQVEHKGELSYIAFDASSVRVIGRAKPVDLSKFVTRVKKPGIKVKPKFSKFIKDPTTKPNAVTVTDLSDVAESNVFTDARMNAIKAGKDTFVVHGKTYKVTGDTTDEREAEITEDLTVTDNPRLRAWIRNIDVSLTKNMRNLFSIVIGLSHDLKTADAVSRSQVIKVLDDKKPEILKYILYHIKHLDEINIKYYVDAMIEIGINWPELKTIQQALNVKKPDRAVTENDYRFSNDHKVMSGLVADEINSWLESLSRNIKAGSKIPNKEIDSFRNVIYAIRNFSYYRLNMLQPVLEQHKKTIIYMILYILKYHSNNLMESEHILSALKYAKINWPELKTIQQALATQGNKTESVTEADDTAGFKILSDIMMRDYADNKVRGFWYMMYHLNDWDMTVDQFPEFDNIIAEIKPKIIKSLLSAVKADSDGEAISNVLYSIDRMHKCGIDWPELKTISQALNVKKPDRAVSENDDRYNDARKQKSEHDARLVSSALEKIRKHITADNAPTVREITSFWDTIYDINVFSGYRMDILQPILEHHKKTIMYMMLYILKHHDMDDPMDEIFTSLRHARIDWPELKTIQQALAQGSKTESVTEASDDNTFELLQKKLATIGRKFNKYDEDSEYWVSNGFPQIQGQVYTLAALGGNNQVIHEISIVYNLKSITDNSKPYQIRPKKFISFGKQKLQELLDPRSVIQVFLHLIKTRASDTQMFKQILKDITKLKTKYDWPELDVIYKALEYQLKPKLPAVATEARDLSKDPLSPWVFALENHIQTKLYWHIAITLEELAMHLNDGSLRVTGDQWAQAAEQLGLDAYKDIIIKSILENLRDNIHSGNSTDWLQRSISTQRIILQKLGCNWPEMDRIAAAVGH